MRISKLMIATSVAFFATACSDGTGPSVNEALINADAATVAGDAAAQDVEVMHGPAAGPFAMGLVWHPLLFNCTRELPTGLTIDRTCTYKDAGGAVQGAYDASTTASVTIAAHITGDFDRGHLSGSVDRTLNLEVSGLAGTETTRTWNGTGSGTWTRVHEASDGNTRSYEVVASSTATNVVVPVPRTATSWPLSGTITRHLTITRANGDVVTRDVTVTFNGTQTVTVSVNGGDSFDFDLSQRGRPHRRG